MNRWERLKPYSNDPLYIASKKCKLGGFVVVYDYSGKDLTGIHRWFAVHKESGAGKWFKTLAQARGFMLTVATASRMDYIKIYFSGYEEDFKKFKEWCQCKQSNKSSR